MLEDENRNLNFDCNDNIDDNNNCCQIKDTPNIPMYSFNFTKVDAEENSCDDKEQTRCKMLNNIRCLSFATNELAQYLNTHADDKKAIMLHNEYSNKLKDLKEKYQMLYGPLNIYFPCNKWRWLEGPWPWERGNF